MHIFDTQNLSPCYVLHDWNTNSLVINALFIVLQVYKTFTSLYLFLLQPRKILIIFCFNYNILAGMIGWWQKIFNNDNSGEFSLPHLSFSRHWHKYTWIVAIKIVPLTYHLSHVCCNAASAIATAMFPVYNFQDMVTQ